MDAKHQHEGVGMFLLIMAALGSGIWITLRWFNITKVFTEQNFLIPHVVRSFVCATILIVIEIYAAIYLLEKRYGPLSTGKGEA